MNSSHLHKCWWIFMLICYMDLDFHGLIAQHTQSKLPVQIGIWFYIIIYAASELLVYTTENTYVQHFTHFHFESNSVLFSSLTRKVVAVSMRVFPFNIFLFSSTNFLLHNFWCTYIYYQWSVVEQMSGFACVSLVVRVQQI